MDALDDVARFRADDDPQLVAAAFACPVCLGLDASARLVFAPADSEVECECAACATEWSVAVDDAQVMRLMLHPPGGEDASPLRMLPSRRADATPSRRQRRAWAKLAAQAAVASEPRSHRALGRLPHRASRA